jgi:hypothetical protein
MVHAEQYLLASMPVMVALVSKVPGVRGEKLTRLQSSRMA